MPTSVAFRAAVVQAVFENVALPWGAQLYLAVSEVDPGDDGSAFAEPTDPGYARVGVDRSPAEFPLTVESVANDTTHTVPAPTSADYDAVAYGWFDTATGGTLLMWAPLANPVTVVVGGGGLVFNPGDLQGGRS